MNSRNVICSSGENKLNFIKWRWRNETEQVHLRLINGSVHPSYPRNSFLLRGTVLLKIKLTFWSIELFIHLDLFGVSCPILRYQLFGVIKLYGTRTVVIKEPKNMIGWHHSSNYWSLFESLIYLFLQGWVIISTFQVMYLKISML